MSIIENDYASCASQQRSDLQTEQPLTQVVTRTATTSDGFAYLHTVRRPDGSPGEPADISSDNHEYFVRYANVIELLHIGGGPSIDGTSQDLTTLRNMAEHLNAYGAGG
jgi:hypothetical protein